MLSRNCKILLWEARLPASLRRVWTQEYGGDEVIYQILILYCIGEAIKRIVRTRPFPLEIHYRYPGYTY